MIRRHLVALRLALIAVDFGAAVAVFLGVSVLRFGPGWRMAWEAAAGNPLVVAASYGCGWVAVLWFLGLYRLRARWSWRAEWVDLLRAILFMAVGTFALLFVARLPDVSRLFLVGLFSVHAVVALTSRWALRVFIARAREHGRMTRYILIVGDGALAHDFARRLRRHGYLGLRVAGFLADPGPDDARPGAVAGLAAIAARAQARWNSDDVIGRFDQIEDVLHSIVIDEVALCLPPEHAAFAGPIARLCEEEGLVVRIPIVDGATVVPGGRIEEFDGIHVQSLVYGPDRALGLIGKRLMDIAAGLVGLAIFSPVMACTALAILLDDGRPVFFRQVRVGLRGRPFRLLKFRTMVPDAEARLEEIRARNEIRGQAFKVTADPRITRLGALLRRTSIDEVPQFWNVLRGDMSLVGPRPPLPSEVAGYDLWHRRRLAMKPGITGLWQVSGRREAEFDRWVAIDLDYIDRWSIWLDLKIILRTFPAMLQGR